MRCYASLKDLPTRPDLAIFCVRDSKLEEAVEDAITAGVKAAVIFGRAYDQAPPGKRTLTDRLSALARDAGMAICGSNCNGFSNAIDDLRVSLALPRLEDRPSGISIVLHSGSMWEWCLCNRRNLTFDYAVSAGQELTTTAGDYIDWFLDQKGIKVVGCVLETVRNPERFLAALQKADRLGVPVVALKLGRSEKGRAFARAHTGALTSVASVYDAVFERYNVVSVANLDELLDTIELFRFRPPPERGGIGSVLLSGGERQLMVDLAEEIGAPIAALTEPTQEALSHILAPGLTPDNPIDAWGDGQLVVRECLEVLEADPNVGITSFAADLFLPGLQQYVTELGMKLSLTDAKPFAILGCAHSSISPDAAARLRACRVPVLIGISNALVAMRGYLAWGSRRRQLRGTPDVVTVPAELRTALATQTVIDPTLSFRILESTGLPLVPSRFVGSIEDAVAAAGVLSWPVVLKTANPDIQHKTERRGVAVNLADEPSLRTAYADIESRCGPLMQIQHQASGVEILLGMVADDQFGPVITLALGGVASEVMRDTTSFLPPITSLEARSFLSRLKTYPLLTGFRGSEPVHLDSLSNVIAAFSSLCLVLSPWVSEIDLNPLLASPTGTLIVDALLVRRAP
jgi:acetate---CoA ligase (ADP-forming)